ncbi:hypothetical protein [Chitinimonas koreensis]|uniref:hypothetical protein n=1 Tax=Chitinimonas koreensis TaxID=356302 RepID=UPI0004258DDE|nr:hypothetical protein [Chitinimonas koreensis]QNM94824.1 hypothetical protein H9L41_12855 [Chitinimonas koreensis]
MTDAWTSKRWLIWIGLLLASAVAAFYPADPIASAEAEVTEAADRRPPAAAAAPTAAAQSGDADSASTDYGDPFAPRQWVAKVEPTPTPPPVVTPPPATPEPAGPPPLPYKFMGSLNDGGVQTIYLSQGEQTVLAKPGAVLDGTYKVLSIDSQQIEFEYLPTGEHQRLPLAAME